MFLEQFGKVFGIVGQLPKFTQILCATNWIRSLQIALQELDYYYDLRGKAGFNAISNETLRELATVLSNSKL
jgi:hypothetical protein